jgi:hypothetical protein
VTWSTLDSGWAQVIGSVAALGVAIYVADRQHQHSLKLFTTTETMTLRRRLESVQAVIEEAENQVKSVTDLMFGEGFYSFLRENDQLSGHNLDFFLVTMYCDRFGKNRKFDDIIEVLKQIPVHELGHQELVHAVFDVKNALIRFDDRILEVCSDLDATGALAGATNTANATKMVIGGAKEQFEKILDAMMISQ